MKISALWPLLESDTQEWLIAHNGEPLSPPVIDDLVDANGGEPDPSWWSEDAADGPALTDAAIDWIEAVANDEEPADD